MTATLRIVLDQVSPHTDPDLALASTQLARALIDTAPSGCEVAALVPAASADDIEGLQQRVPGLSAVGRAALPSRQLAAAWQLGVPAGAGGGLIHSPSLMAPLVKHDRAHDHDQTVVTLWNLDAWEHPGEHSRTSVAWQKGMLRRAARYADAVVVPTHTAAKRVAELAHLGDRIRVMAGAAPADFRVPGDEVGRRRELGIPEGCLLVSGSAAPSARLGVAFEAIARHGGDLPVVVLDAPAGGEPAIADLAAAAGVPERRLHVRTSLAPADRAAVFGGAVTFLAPSTRTHFPWRVVEALRLGVPIVAAASDVHREVIVDGGLLVEPDDVDALAAGIGAALGSAEAAERLGVLAADRGRAFSWVGAAERVWQLHADL